MPSSNSAPSSPIRPRRVLAAAAVLASLLGSRPAEAYCRTSVCADGASGQRCVPSQPIDCGIPLFWAGRCVGFSVQRDASEQVDLATVEALMGQAFAAWENADCAGGQGPSIQAQNLGPVACDQLEYNQQAGNVNAVIFRDDAWPYKTQGNTLALTTVTYNLDTGEIFDADLEVNSTLQVQLTTGDSEVVYDLLSILTHEAGHMLGIAHSTDPEATMKIEYVPGDIELRTLSEDDVAAICAAYPPNRQARCDATPRHGFASECVGDRRGDGDGSCQLAAAPPVSSRAALGLAALVLGGAFQRRRRRI